MLNHMDDIYYVYNNNYDTNNCNNKNLIIDIKIKKELNNKIKIYKKLNKIFLHDHLEQLNYKLLFLIISRDKENFL